MQLLLGNNLDLIKDIQDNSIDAIVTDPPYGLGKEPDALPMLAAWLSNGHYDHSSNSGFMGKTWDAFVPQPLFWKECLRVLKPGGHILTFGGTRTYDLVTLGLRIAGFEIRDVLQWVYGSGFPKSLDVGKAVEKINGSGWQGYGTALKPAYEPIIMARKPLEGTVAQNVLKWGTGGINIDGCRVGTDESTVRKNNISIGGNGIYSGGKPCTSGSTLGRFPANLIHDGSEEVMELFPNTSSGKDKSPAKTSTSGFTGHGVRTEDVNYGDSGSAARFFYCAKAGKAERDSGLDGMPDTLKLNPMRSANGAGEKNFDGGFPDIICKNTHPTVKPLALMRYLCRLITPPNGTILDPYMGSGTTGVAAKAEGFNFVGMEMEEQYFTIAQTRINNTTPPIQGETPQSQLSLF